MEPYTHYTIQIMGSDQHQRSNTLHQQGHFCQADLRMACWSRWVYAEPGWGRIAGLAPLVVSCAQGGDPPAQDILQQGCLDLVTTVQALVQRLQMAQPFRLVLAGSCRVTTCMMTFIHC